MVRLPNADKSANQLHQRYQRSDRQYDLQLEPWLSIRAGKGTGSSTYLRYDQSKAFIEKAREIGTDEKHSAADKLMERLAKTKPEPRQKPSK
jgi:hypothetical protein